MWDVELQNDKKHHNGFIKEVRGFRPGDLQECARRFAGELFAEKDV